MKPELIETYRSGSVRVKLYRLWNGNYKAEIYERYQHKPSHVLTGIFCRGPDRDAACSAISFAMGGCCDADSPCAEFDNDGRVHRETELDIEYSRSGDSYRLRIAQ